MVAVFTIGWPSFTTCVAESGRLNQKVNKRARIFAEHSFIHFSTRVNSQHLVISQNQQVIAGGIGLWVFVWHPFSKIQPGSVFKYQRPPNRINPIYEISTCTFTTTFTTSQDASQSIEGAWASCGKNTAIWPAESRTGVKSGMLHFQRAASFASS